MALTTSNTTLHNSHETENITKAVDHKPTDSKTCTEFRDDHNLTMNAGQLGLGQHGPVISSWSNIAFIFNKYASTSLVGVHFIKKMLTKV